MYKTIEVDRENLTIMGVKFNGLQSLENASNAIGTNMFEGFEPSKELIQLYVDWKYGKIEEIEFINTIYKFNGR